MLYLFDIETIPNDRAKAYFAAKVYEPAANLKDPEKIAANIAEKRAKDAEKAALHWWTGKVVCISVRTVDGKDSGTFSGLDEVQILRAFFDAVGSNHVIGKSGDYFDTPFLVGRALANDIGVPGFLRPHRPIQDVDHIFSFSSQCDQRSNLANYAFGMGIEGKNGHGSEVAALVEAGKWDELRAYCEQDVAIIAEMLRRWNKVYERSN